VILDCHGGTRKHFLHDGIVVLFGRGVRKRARRGEWEGEIRVLPNSDSKWGILWRGRLQVI